MLGVRNFSVKIQPKNKSGIFSNKRMYGVRRFSTSHHSEISGDVMAKLSRVQQLLGTNFKYPKIAVIGNQSSGKSSVLEAISGVELFPKGDNMVTKRPLELTLVRNECEPVHGQFGQMEKKMFDFKEIRDRITAENQGRVTDNPIRLKLFSPIVHNMQVIDLPGLIRVTKHDEDDDLPEDIRRLCWKYVQDTEIIKLIVMSATNDRALSMGLEEVKKAKQFNNAFGVLTKIDLIKDSEALKKMLRDKSYLPGLGLIGVALRSEMDVRNGVSLEEMVQKEAIYIKEKMLDTSQDLRLGVPFLRGQLSHEFIKRISENFPKIIRSIEEHIDKKEKDSSNLATFINNENLEYFANGIENIIDNIHTLSPFRLQFEIKLRRRIGEFIDKYVEGIIAKMNGTFEMKIEKTDDYLNGVRDTMDSCAKKKKDIKMTLEGYLIHSNCTINVENNDFNQMKYHGLYHDRYGHFVNLHLPKDIMMEKANFHRALNRTINGLIDEKVVGQEIQKICIDSLIELIDECVRKTGQDIRTTVFFKYIIDQFQSRIDKDGFIISINNCLQREKTPNIKYNELAKGIIDVMGDSGKIKSFKEKNSIFTTEEFPISVPIFGKAFTIAYLRNMNKRMNNDVYQIARVVVSNKLVSEIIENSMRFFEKFDPEKEQKKLSDEQNELESCLSSLKMASEYYSKLSEEYVVTEEQSKPRIRWKGNTRKQI